MTIYTLKTDPFSSHSKIISIINKEGRPLNILDVGCADGFIDKLLVKYGHTVYGIDKEEGDVKAASKWCRQAYVCNLDNIDSAEFNFGAGFFDIIIFSSIFEHLKNPLYVLNRLLVFLKDEGKVVVAISNIANIYVRLSLLFGRFEYSQRGLLDATHIHFFTLKTARELIRGANLKIESIDVSPIPLPLVFPMISPGSPFFVLQQINYLLAKLFRTLFGYIFVIEARKNI